MKLLFVHDHKFRRHGDELYSLGGLSDEVITYYTNIFEEVTIIARIEDVNEVSDKWSRINNEKVIIKGNGTLKFSVLEKEIEECDALILRLPSFLGFQAWKLNKKINKPYLVEVVACPWDSLWNHSIKGKMLAFPVSVLTKRVAKSAPFVLYVTEKFLQKRYPCTGYNVGVSDVIIEIMNQEGIDKRFEKISKMSKNQIIKLGTVAAVDVKYKGQRFAIEALSILKNKGLENFEYHLVGGGNQEELIATAKKYNVFDKVVFHGALKHEDVTEFLDDLDIYIQPSLQEGLPRAVVEAMSRGCPCIAAKTGGCPELLLPTMICSRKNMAVDIVDKILYLLSKDNMKISAQHSLKRATNFQKEILDKKRKDFMDKFLKYCKKQVNKK